MLTVIDEFSRERLAIHVQRQIRSDDVLAELIDLFARHGPPAHIRSDNGAEFSAIAVRDWLRRVGVKTLYIEPGSPWENGYCERLQWQASRRIAQRRNLLHTGGDENPDRELAATLQHDQAAQLTRLCTAGTTAILPRSASLLYAPPRSANLGDHNRQNSNLSSGPP